MKKENGVFLQDFFAKGLIEIREDGSIWSKVTNAHKATYKDRRDGYPCIIMRGKEFKVHQAVWVWFNGIVPDGFEIDHIDNNKLNNRIDNLQLLTPQQNYMKQAALIRGANNFSCKITEDQVREIRKRSAAGETIRAIAKDYPVSRTQINRIIKRKKWAWLD